MWIITKDFIADDTLADCNREGVCSAEFRLIAFSTKKQIKFRLLDDDMNVYYSGLMTEERFHGPADCWEGPLDPLEWAMEDSGCTILQYFDEDEQVWKALAE